MMRHIFVINPVAGQGVRIAELLAEIDSASQKTGQTEVETYLTQSVGDAKEYAARVCREHPDKRLRFYACGGDGTLNEVLNGMMGFPNAELACYPCGSGNDFIYNFGQAQDFLRIESLMTGETTLCDCIRMGHKTGYRYGVNICNVGFDARIAAEMTAFKRLPLIQGEAAYYLSVFWNLLHKLGMHLTVTLDSGEELQDEFLLAAMGNGRRYGGGFLALPQAKVRDGLLDYCCVRKVSRFKIAKLVSKYKKGEHIGNEEFASLVTAGRCRRLSVTSQTPVKICCDGEISTGTELWVEIVPNAFSFVLPFAGTDSQEKKQDNP